MLTFGTFSLGGGDIGAVHHEHFFFLSMGRGIASLIG